MPRHSTPTEGQFVTAEPRAETQSVTIVFIEDNTLVRNLVKEILEQEGWLVHAYQDGVSALTRLERDDGYDLIMTDNDMPGMCGLELIRRIRAIAHHQCTPIIMLSANPYQPEAKHAGADAFLRKPEDVFAIPQTIARLLGIGPTESGTKRLMSGTASRPDTGS